MAITFTLVAQGSNHLVYLAMVDQNGPGIGVIQQNDIVGGNADVAMEDAVVPPAGAQWKAGLLKKIIDLDTITDQGLARRQLLDWGLAPVTGDGILNVPGKRARADVMQINAEDVGERMESLIKWAIDADIDGYGHGIYTVCCEAIAARALIRIEAIGTPIQF